MKKEIEKYKLNKITPEEWWESVNSPIFGRPFYPARYHYPRPFHIGFVAPIKTDYNTDNKVFLTHL